MAVSFEFSDPIRPPAYVVDGGEGTYTMAYRAMSADGHPVTGQITFSVGDASTEAGSAADTVGQASSPPAADTGSTAVTTPTDEGNGFWPRHGIQVLVGVALWGLAGALFVLSRRGTCTAS